MSPTAEKCYAPLSSRILEIKLSSSEGLRNKQCYTVSEEIKLNNIIRIVIYNLQPTISFECNAFSDLPDIA